MEPLNGLCSNPTTQDLESTRLAEKGHFEAAMSDDEDLYESKYFNRNIVPDKTKTGQDELQTVELTSSRDGPIYASRYFRPAMIDRKATVKPKNVTNMPVQAMGRPRTFAIAKQRLKLFERRARKDTPKLNRSTTGSELLDSISPAMANRPVQSTSPANDGKQDGIREPDEMRGKARYTQPDKQAPVTSAGKPDQLTIETKAKKLHKPMTEAKDKSEHSTIGTRAKVQKTLKRLLKRYKPLQSSPAKGNESYKSKTSVNVTRPHRRNQGKTANDKASVKRQAPVTTKRKRHRKINFLRPHCPFCARQLKDPLKGTTHLKSCAKKHNTSTIELISIMDLQDKRLKEERQKESQISSLEIDETIVWKKPKGFAPRRRKETKFNMDLPLFKLTEEEKRANLREKVSKIINQRKTDMTMKREQKVVKDYGFGVPKLLIPFHDKNCTLWKKSQMNENLPADAFSILEAMRNPDDYHSTGFEQFLCGTSSLRHSVINDIMKTLDKEAYSDMILLARGNQEVKCNTFMFHARCPSIFKDSDNQTGGKRRLVTKVVLTNYSYEAIKAFVTFVYSGEISALSREMLGEFYEIADRYEMDIGHVPLHNSPVPITRLIDLVFMPVPSKL